MSHRSRQEEADPRIKDTLFAAAFFAGVGACLLLSAWTPESSWVPTWQAMNRKHTYFWASPLASFAAIYYSVKIWRLQVRRSLTLPIVIAIAQLAVFLILVCTMHVP